MGRYFSKDQLLMRETWRKAFRAEHGLRLEFPSEANAHRCRMLLYSAVRMEKTGGGDDEELKRAAESVEIVFGEGKNVLLMRHRQDNPIFQALSEATGIELEKATMPEALESQEKMLRELERMGLAPEIPPTNDNARTGAGAREEGLEGPPLVKNPFYTRDE